MANSSTTQNRNKKKGVAFGLIGAVICTGFIVGGTNYANLNQTINDAPDSSHVYSEEFDKFGFVYHESSQAFDTDISVTDTMYFKTDVKNFIVTNTGDIAAQYVFSNADVPDIDEANPIWDETHVIVHMNTNSDKIDQWAGTMREYLGTAFVTNDILQPGEDVAVTVEVLSPSTYTWSSDASAEAVDIRFNTEFTFNQLTTPSSSPLLDYAMANGDQRGGLLKPEMNSYFANRLTSGMTTTYTLPVEEVAQIKL